MTETDRHPRIRTFHARHGRLNPGLRAVLDELGPRYAPDWSALPSPLVVEVGCGNGGAAIAYATGHPAHHVLALDVHRPGIAQLLRDVDAAAVSNLSVAATDALSVLDDHVLPASLTGLHLFFPDPWPKARHHKRRFVRLDVLDLVASRLEPGGRFLVATDAPDYAAAIAEVVGAHPAFAGGAAPRPAWRPVTTYERKAADEGRAVHDFAFVRVAGSGPRAGRPG